MRFGDRSSIEYEGKGDVQVSSIKYQICTNGEPMMFLCVPFVPNLKTNILSLVKLDDEGRKTVLQDGFLTVQEKNARFLTKTLKTTGKTSSCRKE